MVQGNPFSRFLRETVDPGLARFLRFAASLDLPLDPALVRLAGRREEAMRRTASELAERAKRLEAAVVARDPEAIRRYDELLEEAITRMRSTQAEGEGRLETDAILGSIERRLYKNEPERLDDPSLPEDERSDELEALDRFNHALGTYDIFIDILTPLIERAERDIASSGERRPVRLHDLASGHAGFAVFLKQKLGDRVDVEASDIMPEYLAIGSERAKALGVRVDFYTEDALAMDGPRARGVDILLCTQSIHHFSPGMVARMIGEGVRAARAGLCLIDGERSWLMLGKFLIAASLYPRHRWMIRDGVVSIRRMFYKEEVGLLAALAPGMPQDTRIEMGSTPPAHGYLRVTRVAPPPGGSS